MITTKELAIRVTFSKYSISKELYSLIESIKKSIELYDLGFVTDEELMNDVIYDVRHHTKKIKILMYDLLEKL